MSIRVNAKLKDISFTLRLISVITNERENAARDLTVSRLLHEVVALESIDHLNGQLTNENTE
jgi:hypothetical protein